MIIYFELLIKNMDAFSIIQFFMIKLFTNIQVPNQFKITPFNKRYSTVYGKFLKHFINDVELLAYKEPSHIKYVSNKKIVEEFYNKNFSDDADGDKFFFV